jgi:hypothetical protein
MQMNRPEISSNRSSSLAWAWGRSSWFERTLRHLVLACASPVAGPRHRLTGNDPSPIIVSIHGPAADCGLGLVLAADIAVAVDTAIGLSCDCGVRPLLPGAVGARRTALFALTNQPALSC